jgi:hypothetical protein
MSRALGAIPLTLISDIEFNMVIMVHGFESFFGILVAVEFVLSTFKFIFVLY